MFTYTPNFDCNVCKIFTAPDCGELFEKGNYRRRKRMNKTRQFKTAYNNRAGYPELSSFQMQRNLIGPPPYAGSVISNMY